MVIFLILTAFFVWPKIVFGQIVINEIMYDLKDGTDDGHEWIELYNNGPLDIDLTGGKINDGDNDTNHGFNTTIAKTPSRGSLIIPADGFIILADDSAKIAYDISDYQGSIIDTVFNLKNTAGQLKIIDKDNLVLASLGYNKDLGAAGNGRTLEWDGTVLKESTVDGGTPGRTNSILSLASLGPAPPDPPATATATTPSPDAAIQTFDYSQNILINEFLPWPNENEKEWVELLNAGSSAVNLSGWQIDDADNSTSPQVIPENTIIYPNGFLIISFNKSTLNNDGDKVRLLWPDNQTVHAVSYDKAKQNQAVAKFDNGWLWTNQPTPGSVNKKSAAKNNESTALAIATKKINPVEESVAPTASSMPNKKSPAAQTATDPRPIASPASQSSDNPEKINLSASIDEPIKENPKIISVLSLIGVILLASLAAGALIYFRRQKQIDIEGADD